MTIEELNEELAVILSGTLADDITFENGRYQKVQEVYEALLRKAYLAGFDEAVQVVDKVATLHFHNDVNIKTSLAFRRAEIEKGGE